MDFGRTFDTTRFVILSIVLLGNLISHIVGQGVIVVTQMPGVVTPAGATPNPNPLCQCTLISNCADGTGNIDPRVLNNPGGGPTCVPPNRFCCNLITPNPTTVPPAGSCGVQPLLPFPGFTPAAGQASYTQYPWMTLILGTDNSYIAGGVLIDATTVLTIAHRVTNLAVSLKVRLGEYILNSVTEPVPPLEILVTAIRIHELYQAPPNLLNDIAVLKLATPVNFATSPNIVPICLPATGASFTSLTCWTSGWGTNANVNGAYQSVLTQVDLPVLAGPSCQTAFQNTRLGAGFVFNQLAYLCAGGVQGKDACTGDGGSPLVCQVGTQWMLAGLVSWGIGCGASTIPGAYTNIPNYIPWITSHRF